LFLAVNQKVKTMGSSPEGRRNLDSQGLPVPLEYSFSGVSCLIVLLLLKRIGVFGADFAH
jgi:hypothetical protein